MKTFAIIYGTRPEFLKVKPLITGMREAGIQLKVIRVVQHSAISETLDADVEIPIEDGTNRLSAIGSSILTNLPAHLQSITALIVQGDTATAFYAALTAFQSRIPVIHLEAGMRTFDLENPFPEEGYRQMISRITTIHLCPSLLEAALLNMREGVEADSIHIVGNTILDLVKSYNLKVSRSKNIVLTLHRRENWDAYGDYLREIADLARRNEDYQFNFYAHMNPALQNQLAAIEMPPNFQILAPVGHRDLMEAVATCALVITDSGGIQEEANFLGKHVYVLRKCTERGAIDRNKLTLIPDPASVATIRCDVPDHGSGYEYGDGDATSKIIEVLKIRYSL